MKKYIVLFIACVLSISANAQFKATHDGIKTVDGTDYYVVNIQNKSASELYASVK